VPQLSLLLITNGELFFCLRSVNDPGITFVAGGFEHFLPDLMTTMDQFQTANVVLTIASSSFAGAGQIVSGSSHAGEAMGGVAHIFSMPPASSIDFGF
jgi:hypothetical protein